jgi:hypothetical protein
MYSLEELLGLFHLSYDISIDDLHRAKKQVLMTHPDKSKLPPDYFLFYKKAFDIIVRFYENQTKQNKEITEENTTYQPTLKSNVPTNHRQISKAIQEMSAKEFHERFHTLFQENMQQRPDPAKNAWFTTDSADHTIHESVNQKNMGQLMDQIKEKQAAMVRYRGVETLYVNSGSGTKLYEDEDEDLENQNYVECDPFSKLKFDDLRKVHKDQTVFSVSEKDYRNHPQYSSVDHFVRERGKQSLTPLEKQEAEKLLQHQEQQHRNRILQKEHAGMLKTMQNEEKNRTVLANFLRLGNG